MRNSSLFLAVSLAAASAHAALPQRVEIVYEVQHNGTPMAEVVDRLEHDGQTYRLQETWKGRGLFALRGEARRQSQGAIARDGLRPAEFEEQASGREPRRTKFPLEGDAATPLQQDRLSVAWTFALAPPRAPVTVRVADGKGVATHTYDLAGRERVATIAGEFDALKLVRRKDKPDARTVELWLAADRQHLPVRIRVTEKNGTQIDQVAARILMQ